MTQQNRLLIILAWTSAAIFLCLAGSSAQTKSQKSRVPKIWDAKELATWATPIAGVNATPNYYTEEEYYSAPVDNLRTS
jgi:hypothetical protein